MTERKRLDSWKEIAAHLRVETRTAMRWEDDRALPVHRVPGGGRAAVFAYADEIDAWLLGQPAESLMEAAAGEANASALPAAAEARNSNSDPEASGRKTVPASPAWMSRGAAVALVSALAVVILVAFAVTWRGGSSREVVRVSFAGEKLIAWDSANREVWSHEFPGRLQEPAPGKWNGGSEPARLVDLDGNGKREVLAVVFLPTGPNRDDPYSSELYCYRLDGKLRWHYRPENKLKFRDREYEGPWLIYEYVVSPPGAPRSIWLAVAHHQWWPAFVVKLDAAGNGTVQFVNSGLIYSLGFVQNPSGTYLLAGGVNNEPYAGMMAVLDMNGSPATSPQTAGSEFECRNCPPGKPARYFVFPPTELNQFSVNRLNAVNTFLRAGNTLGAQTIEHWPSALAFYEFSLGREVLPIGLRFSDGFKVVHEQLEKEGKLKHTFEQCPDRTKPKIVRMWTPPRGWEDVPVGSSPTRH